MYRHEFGLALAWAVKHERGGGDDIALLFEDNVLKNIQKAPPVNSVETGFGVPIVRLLRNRGRRFDAANMFIYATYVPTEACLGMARLCGIDVVFCVSENKVWRCNLNRARATWTNWVPDDEGDIPNVMTAGNAAVLKWYQNPGAAGARLIAWRDYVRRGRDAVGNAAYQAGVKDILNQPNAVPAFGDTGLEDISLRQSLGTDVADSVSMMLAFEMVAEVHGGYADNAYRGAGYFGQNIGALLADAHGAIVAWSVNTNYRNATEHAEANLLLNWVTSAQNDGALPDGGTLYTTLEPCEMCAGMITRAVRTARTLRVIYAQRDKNVGETALKKKVKNTITTTESTAPSTTWGEIHAGRITGAASWPAAIAQAHTASKIPEITRYVETEDALSDIFSLGRPAWWLYLWEVLSAQTRGKNPEHPDVVRATQILRSMQIVGDAFIANVRRIGP